MKYNVDMINGVFEGIGAILCWMNAWKLWKDKQIKGVMWEATAFFAAWGWWNCLYYPALNQWYSFAGALLLVTGNTLWVLMAIRYREKSKCTV